MIEAMREVAGELGAFLPGSEPRFLPLGTSTHTMGATRMGVAGDGKSVVDSHSLVHGFENLYLGGNCLIPTANASNPTLTSVALAVRAARHMIGYCASVRPDAV
jgi:choline dehydrogenase-like flavoprotein